MEESGQTHGSRAHGDNVSDQWDYVQYDSTQQKIWRAVALTWMTPSIMLTILLTMAMTLCVLSDGDMSGR